MGTGSFTIGVEEEFLLVDADSGALRPDGPALLPAARDRLGEDVHPELHPSQLETNTPVGETLGEVRAALIRLRSRLAATLAAGGCRLAATGTHPFSAWSEEASPDRLRLPRAGPNVQGTHCRAFPEGKTVRRACWRSSGFGAR